MTCASPSPAAYLRNYELDDEPLLTADQECDLAAAAARGDVGARDRLVRGNLRLVLAFSRRYSGRGLDQEDLAGEGILGLIKAATRFNPAFGVRFATYARHWIEQAIREALTDRSRAVRLPAHMVTLLRAWRRAELVLTRRSGRAPSFDQLADHFGLPPSRCEMVRRALQAEATAGGNPVDASGTPVAELAATVEAPGAGLERTEELAGLERRMAARLDTRERLVLGLRFGLGGGEPLTLKDVARRLGLTREWVRNIEHRAVDKLR